MPKEKVELILCRKIDELKNELESITDELKNTISLHDELEIENTKLKNTLTEQAKYFNGELYELNERISELQKKKGG